MEEIKLTKKQKREIARVWVGNFIMETDLGGMPNYISNDDAQEILEEVHKFGLRVLSNRFQSADLEEIIKHVTKREGE